MASYLQYFSLLLLYLSFLSPVFGAANTSKIDVGVILDTSSHIGRISWTCMQRSLEDFYLAHPNYTSRISFALRDLRSDASVTDNDAFGTAMAAVDLLKNVRVQAIIGPQTSTQAKFLIQLGNKSNVPLISFSAKSPYISFGQTPYFVRTSWNDSAQATVIASLVQHFNWSEVVPVFEDTDYGTKFVPYLVDALQGVDAQVPNKCKIPLFANDKQIKDALDYLKANIQRVFVVHMSYELALRFFTFAKQAEMMETGFVWVTTYELTAIVDQVGSDATNVMNGVLGIRPFIPETDARRKLTSKLGMNPSVFGLWAYDTVWLLAQKLEHIKPRNLEFKVPYAQYETDISKIGVSEMGKNLILSLKNSNFNGIAGKFTLINGQLQSGTFELTNVVESQNKRVGSWDQSNGVYLLHNSIIWPGNNTDSTPKGWEWPKKKILKIGIPCKPGFDEFVKWNNETKKAGGYCIDVFNAAIAALPYEVHCEFEQYADADGNPKGTYDELVYQVYLKKYDAVVGDITILANRSQYVDFTLPFTESGVRMLVPIKKINCKTKWAFWQPLKRELWLATGAFFILTAIIVWFIEHRTNEEFRGRPLNQVGTSLYFSFSTLVFAQRERIGNNLSRIVVIIWIFVVLVLQQSYTASLTSNLTAEQLQPTLTNLDQVVKAGSPVGYLNDSFMPSLLKRMGVSNMMALSSPKEYKDALDNGSVAAIVDEIPYLKEFFLKNYSDNYTMVGPTYKIDGFGFAFPIGSPLVPDMSRAILKVMEGGYMTKLDQGLYGNKTFADMGNTTTSNSLTLSRFFGLFLITGATSLAALIIHGLIVLCGNHNFITKFTHHERPQNFIEKNEPRVEQLANVTISSLDFSDTLESIVVSSSDTESAHEDEISADPLEMISSEPLHRDPSTSI